LLDSRLKPEISKGRRGGKRERERERRKKKKIKVRKKRKRKGGGGGSVSAFLSIASQCSIGYCIFERLQDLLACLPDMRSTTMMIKGRALVENKGLREYLSQCHFVHCKSDIVWSR
jgi:hypothetical protein